MPLFYIYYNFELKEKYQKNLKTFFRKLKMDIYKCPILDFGKKFWEKI